MANPTKSNHEQSKTYGTVPTQVTGRDMTTGKVVSLTEYLKRKRRQAAEYLEELKTNPIEQQPTKAYTKLLNKTVNLGRTPSGQKVTGKFIQVKKIIKPPQKGKALNRQQLRQLNSPQVTAKINENAERLGTVGTSTVDNENNTIKNFKVMSNNAPFLIKIFRLDDEATSCIEKNTAENIIELLLVDKCNLDNKIPIINETNTVENQTYFDPNFIKDIIQNFREIPANAPALVEICSLDKEIISKIEPTTVENQISFNPIKEEISSNLRLESFGLNNETTQNGYAENLSKVPALARMDNKIIIYNIGTDKNPTYLDSNLINNYNNPEKLLSNPPLLVDAFSLDNKINIKSTVENQEYLNFNLINNTCPNVEEIISNTTVLSQEGYNRINYNNQIYLDPNSLNINIQNFEEIPFNTSFLVDTRNINQESYANFINTTVQNETEILSTITLPEQNEIEDPNLAISTNQKFSQEISFDGSLLLQNNIAKEIKETTQIDFDPLDLLNGILEDHKYSFNSVEQDQILNTNQKNNVTSEEISKTKETFDNLDFFKGVLEDHKYTFNLTEKNIEKMDLPSQNTCLKESYNLNNIKNNDNTNIVKTQNKILQDFGNICSSTTLLKQDNIKIEENTFDALDLNDILEEHKYTDFKFNFVEKNNPEVDLLSQIMVDHTYTDYKIDPLEGINPCDIMEEHRYTDFSYSLNLHGVLEDPFYNETVVAIQTDHQLEKETHSAVHSILTDDKSDHERDQLENEKFSSTLDDENLIESSLLSFDALKHHSYSSFSKQLKNKCKKSIPTEIVNQHEYIKTESKKYKRRTKGKTPDTLVPRKRIKYIYRFTCEICNKVFKNRLRMLCHMETRVCQDKKIYKYCFGCKGCSRKFRRMATLQKHEKICGDKPAYVCSLCGATYKNQTSLTKHHIQIHCKQQDSENQLNFEDVPMEVITEDNMIVEEGNNAS